MRAWDKFWFGDQDLLKVSAFRFLIASFCLAQYGYRFREFEGFYSNQGLLPAQEALATIPEIARPVFAMFPYSDSTLYGCYWVFLAFLTLMVLGLGGRVVTFGAYLLHVMFVQRNYTVMYGADFVVTHWLLYLSLVDHTRYFSVRNLFSSPKTPPPRTAGFEMIHPLPFGGADLLSRVGVRLLQVQLCIIYAYTGLEKLKGAPWWEGAAVWNVLGNQQLVSAHWSFLKNFPMFIFALTFSSVLFEVYFPALIWSKKLRGPLLLLGFGFHFGIAGIMGFYFFSLVMATAYLNFVDDSWLRRFLSRMVPYRLTWLARFISPTAYV